MILVREEYQARFDQVLEPLARQIEAEIRNLLEGEPRIDRIQARPKSVERFVEKASKSSESGEPKYKHPFLQNQDQVGVRIVVFYLSDVDRVSNIVEKYFRTAEAKTLVPESEWSFGYFGKHYILLVPAELKSESWAREKIPTVFELQIKTLFQHAWSEANHDLGYKPETKTLEPDDLRRLAFTSAQAWGADQSFEQLFKKASC